MKSDLKNFIPKRRRGQNFLVDKNVINKIIKQVGLKKSDLVLEIGPGTGLLTKSLAENCAKVFAVEIDKQLFDYLNIKLNNYDNIFLLKENVLSENFDQQFAHWLAKNSIEKKYKIVANLPYNITSAVIRKFLSKADKPEEMIIMIQKEVARRLTAHPPDMNLLALAVQFYSQPKILFSVSRNSFKPRPKVDSSLVKLELNSNNLNFLKKSALVEKDFFQLLRAGFSHKRKKLISNLSQLANLEKKQLIEVFSKLNLPADSRPQQLSLADWLGLIISLKDKNYYP